MNKQHFLNYFKRFEGLLVCTLINPAGFEVMVNQKQMVLALENADGDLSVVFTEDWKHISPAADFVWIESLDENFDTVFRERFMEERYEAFKRLAGPLFQTQLNRETKTIECAKLEAHESNYTVVYDIFAHTVNGRRIPSGNEFDYIVGFLHLANTMLQYLGRRIDNELKAEVYATLDNVLQAKIDNYNLRP